VRIPQGEKTTDISDDFEALGAAFDTTGYTRLGRIGAADARLLRQREAVDFAVAWLERNRR
jgi:aminoglycoside 3-N-acetyltransferase